MAAHMRSLEMDKPGTLLWGCVRLAIEWFGLPKAATQACHREIQPPGVLNNSDRGSAANGADCSWLACPLLLRA